MGKFLFGVLAGVLCHSVYEIVLGPELLKEKLDEWTSKEKYPALNKYWNSKSENPESSEN